MNKSNKQSNRECCTDIPMRVWPSVRNAQINNQIRNAQINNQNGWVQSKQPNSIKNRHLINVTKPVGVNTTGIDAFYDIHEIPSSSLQSSSTLSERLQNAQQRYSSKSNVKTQNDLMIQLMNNMFDNTKNKFNKCDASDLTGSECADENYGPFNRQVSEGNHGKYSPCLGYEDIKSSPTPNKMLDVAEKENMPEDLASNQMWELIANKDNLKKSLNSFTFDDTPNDNTYVNKNDNIVSDIDSVVNTDTTCSCESDNTQKILIIKQMLDLMNKMLEKL